MSKDFLEIASMAAQQAGQILMKYYGKNLDVIHKNNDNNTASVVTIADIESEARITDILKTQFPDHSIRGEEGVTIQKDADYVWYVDPLDGTSNFIRNIPLFGISIGLLYKDDPIVGVLYFPALNLLVKSSKGGGAFANEKPISVSNRALSESLYYSGSWITKGDLVLPLAKEVQVIKIIDTSSYELAQIAMGDAEVYYLSNVVHDVVAGVCIIREAGGRVTDGVGNTWKINSKMILATNGIVHNRVLEITNL